MDKISFLKLKVGDTVNTPIGIGKVENFNIDPNPNHDTYTVFVEAIKQSITFSWEYGEIITEEKETEKD